MLKLFSDHPFLSDLARRIIMVVVTYNVIAACFFASAVGLIILGAIGAAAAGETDTINYTSVYGRGQQRLLSIPVTGVIIGSEPSGGGSLFAGLEGQTSGYSVKDQLYLAADDDSIGGVVLEVNSPGGTIYGAHAIADGVAYYKKKTGQPVVAHIEGAGASGAYWAAVSADKVVSDYGSLVGSIGVIMGPFQYYDKVLSEDGGLLGGGVMTQNGIESVTITAGRSKDIGNPYRRLTADELDSLQRQINNEYDDFVSYVSQRRGIADATIRGDIGAMIYDPKTALSLRLVDAIGSRQDAYDRLAELAHVPRNYTIIREEKLPGFVESLLAVTGMRPRPTVQAADLCSLAGARLAYHGDVTAWCK